MDPAKEIAIYLADLLDEKQAADIVILNVEDLVGYTSYFVIASGRSERHVKSLGDHLRRVARTDSGIRTIGQEGVQSGRWALLDYGDAVVHIFRDDDRHEYDLEGLWQDAPRLEWPGAVREESAV